MNNFVIAIAPTKTMHHSDVSPKHNTQLFEVAHKTVLKKLQSLSYEALKDVLKASDKLVKAAQENIVSALEEDAALFAYAGAQFSALDVNSLTALESDYLEAHAIILSGLYGVLRPYDRVMHYRLPMASKVDGIALTKYWKGHVETFFQDKTIINLASKEYADILPKKNLITIRFMTKKGETLKTTPGVHAKPTRGMFLREAARKQAKSVKAFQRIVANEHYFSEADSSELEWVYIKNGSKAV